MKDGKCVRLYQGLFDRETVYSDDPVEVAMKWQERGACRLHVIDLDGAATGELGNMDIIVQIVNAALIPIQVGGGVRNLETVKDLLKAGVERVILGTSSIENPELVKEACRLFGNAIIVSIDTKDGHVAVRGWQLTTSRESIELAQTMALLGVKRFVYTDISRDGTLTEPNFSAFAELLNSIRLPVIASGGISSLTHLKMLKQLGAEAAIVGKALYNGDIDLKEALESIAD